MATSTPVAQTGLFNRFWPNLITNEGQINHQGMIRRMETVLGLMVPGALTFYTVLECCHCQHSAMITLLCSIPVPAIFGTIDEYRADSAFERIETLRKAKLASSQTHTPSGTGVVARRSILKTAGMTSSRRVTINEPSQDAYASGSLPELQFSQS